MEVAKEAAERKQEEARVPLLDLLSIEEGPHRQVVGIRGTRGEGAEGAGAGEALRSHPLRLELLQVAAGRLEADHAACRLVVSMGLPSAR